MAQELREHFALGRLDADELAARLERVYAARTVGELAEQRADLPDLPRPPALRTAEVAKRRGELRRQVIQQSGGSVGVFVVCVAIWASSGSGAFWPAFVLIGGAAFLARNLWRLYGPAPELDRVEAELHRRRRSRGGRRGRHGAQAGRSLTERPRTGEAGGPLGSGGRVE